GSRCCSVPARTRDRPAGGRCRSASRLAAMARQRASAWARRCGPRPTAPARAVRCAATGEVRIRARRGSGGSAHVACAGAAGTPRGRVDQRPGARGRAEARGSATAAPRTGRPRKAQAAFFFFAAGAAASGAGASTLVSTGVLPSTSMRPPALRKASRSWAMRSRVRVPPDLPVSASLRPLVDVEAVLRTAMSSPWSVEGEREAALPLVAVAGTDVDAGPAAHRELAADGGTVFVDRATQVQRIDRRAPAVLVLGHGFQAVFVDGDVPGGHPVARQQQDRQAAAHCVAAPAVHAGLQRAQDFVPGGKGRLRGCAMSAPADRWVGKSGRRMATPWKRLRTGAGAAWGRKLWSARQARGWVDCWICGRL